MATKQKSSKPVPAQRVPGSLTAPHLLPFSPLSPEEGTSRKRLAKPFDFILLHPLNGQKKGKKKEKNRCRRQHFQLTTKSSKQIPSRLLTRASFTLGLLSKESVHKGGWFYLFIFMLRLRNTKWELCS